MDLSIFESLIASFIETKLFFFTGSSNGTFVNNIRLSKGGEESKMTEIFTNDILRFGSDIVDKSRQVYNPCSVIIKIRDISQCIHCRIFNSIKHQPELFA